MLGKILNIATVSLFLFCTLVAAKAWFVVVSYAVTPIAPLRRRLSSPRSLTFQVITPQTTMGNYLKS